MMILERIGTCLFREVAMPASAAPAGGGLQADGGTLLSNNGAPAAPDGAPA